MSEEREVLDWAGYGVAARDLAQIVADDDYQPDIILAIARGGLFVAGSLGYALSVKNLYVMNVEYYTGVDERLDVPVQLPPYLDTIDLNDSRVLIADDVADTGAHARVRSRLLPGRGGRRAQRGAVREVSLDHQVRVRLEAHRPVDQLPLVDRRADHGARRWTRKGPRRLGSAVRYPALYTAVRFLDRRPQGSPLHSRSDCRWTNFASTACSARQWRSSIALPTSSSSTRLTAACCHSRRTRSSSTSPCGWTTAATRCSAATGSSTTTPSGPTRAACGTTPRSTSTRSRPWRRG